MVAKGYFLVDFLIDFSAFFHIFNKFQLFLQLEQNLRNLKLSGHVGFDSLPDQLVNKSVQSGFVFNIMCIGEFHCFCSNFLANHKLVTLLLSVYVS